jgi:CheY-like chemotaxis protein
VTNPRLLWRLFDGAIPTECELRMVEGQWVLSVRWQGKHALRAQYASEQDAHAHAALLRANLLASGWINEPVVAPARARYRVLLVGPHSSLRDRVQRDLEAIHVATDTASALADALDTIQQRAPDLVLLHLADWDADWGADWGDASAIVRRLRADLPNSRFVVVANAADGAVVACGADAVIGPLDNVAASVARLLGTGADA